MESLSPVFPTIPGYEIQASLGQGGAGEVYRGVDTRTGTPVAIKILKPEVVASDPEAVQRFVREAEVLRALDHPNIVKVLAALEENRVHYLVMEYVRGGSLSDVLEREGQLSVDRTLEVALDLVDALTRAHRLGIIHRDIKPGNVLLERDGTPRLSDFGLARVSSSRMTQVGTLMGTPDYLSPEMCRGQEVDARADIWALGVLLFQMLSGELPFKGDNFPAIVLAITTQPTPDLKVLRPDAPDDLIDLIDRMLEKDPESRLPSVRLVGAEVEAMTQGAKGWTDKVGLSPKTGKEPKKGPKAPSITTSFVGREQELLDIARLIDQPSCRLLTLVGPGGVGKTRLAIQAASERVGMFSDGAYFVPLAPVADPEDIVPTVAQVMQFNFDSHSSELDPQSQLLDYLRMREALLVMDNFEHLIQGTDVVAALLEGAPGLKILITSREKLNLGAEWTFEVLGMAYPTDGELSELEKYSAVRLFLERGRQVDSSFDPNDEDMPPIKRICQLLEGLPLGIELAAAWLPALSCRDIVVEIEKSVDFLASQQRDLPAKHRSLRAVFEGSWGMLDVAQKSAFQKLAVFRGGFDRRAAQEIAGANSVTLLELINKSMLRRTADNRYEIHEMLRQFAEELLHTHPEEWATVHQHHSEFYIQYVSSRAGALFGNDLVTARAEIRLEKENFRSGVHWAALHGNIDQIRQALNLYFDFFLVQGWYEGTQAMQRVALLVKEDYGSRDREGTFILDPAYLKARVIQSWFCSNLSLIDESQNILDECLPHLRVPGLNEELAMALSAAGINEYLRGDNQAAIENFAETLALGEGLGDLFFIGATYAWSGWVFLDEGELVEAQNVLKMGYDLFRRSGNILGIGFALSKMGLAADAEKDYARARRYYEEGLEIFNRFEDQAGLAYTNSRLSQTAYAEGHYNEAVHYGQLGLAQFEGIGHKWGVGACLCRIGFAYIELNELEKAEDCFHRALELATSMEHIPLSLYALAGIANLLAVTGEEVRAVELSAFVLSRHEATGYRDLAGQRLPGLEASLGAAVYTAAFERGQAAQLDEMVRLHRGA